MVLLTGHITMPVQIIPVRLEVSEELKKEILDFCLFHKIYLNDLFDMVSEKGRIPLTAELISQVIHTH